MDGEGNFIRSKSPGESDYNKNKCIISITTMI